MSVNDLEMERSKLIERITLLSGEIDEAYGQRRILQDKVVELNEEIEVEEEERYECKKKKEAQEFEEVLKSMDGTRIRCKFRRLNKEIDSIRGNLGFRSTGRDEAVLRRCRHDIVAKMFVIDQMELEA